MHACVNKKRTIIYKDLTSFQLKHQYINQLFILHEKKKTPPKFHIKTLN